jgi:tetratricopeptide (TPR) repeat protein
MNDRKVEQLLNKVRQAQGAIDEQEPQRALTLMKQVLGEMAHLGVVSAHAHWVMGVAYDLSQEVEMAFEEVRKAMALDPLAAPFRHSFSIVVGRIRGILSDPARPEHDEATPRLYALLSRSGDADVAAHLAMVRFHLATGAVAEARALVDAVVLLNPADASAWSAKARVARAAGDQEAAVLAEAEAASLAPAEAPFGSTTVAEA